MGAWGAGSFENDSARDWAASVQSADVLRETFDRLKSSEGAHLDADLACEVIAAAETVAMLMGRRSRDFPEDLAQRLAGAGEPVSDVYHAARGAVLRVMRDSELAELWEETAQASGENEWLCELTGLIDRLNPDLEATPWSPEEVENRVGQVLQTCAFCDRPVPSDELFLMTVYDASNRLPGNRGMWLHLACLNARLHYKHAIANLKFDPDNMPDLDKL